MTPSILVLTWIISGQRHRLDKDFPTPQSCESYAAIMADDIYKEGGQVLYSDCATLKVQIPVPAKLTATWTMDGKYQGLTKTFKSKVLCDNYATRVSERIRGIGGTMTYAHCIEIAPDKTNN